MRNTPTELVLLQIAEGLQNLAKNPDLSKTIKDAYALSEDEKAKSEEARAVIVQSDKFLADLKAQKDALADIEERISEAEKLENFNADTLKSIRQQQSENAQYEARNDTVAGANEKKSSELDAREKFILSREAKIHEAESGLRLAKADFKKRTDLMKAQAEGL